MPVAAADDPRTQPQLGVGSVSSTSTVRRAQPRGAERTSAPSEDTLDVVPGVPLSVHRQLDVDPEGAAPADAHAVLDGEADTAVVARQRAL